LFSICRMSHCELFLLVVLIGSSAAAQSPDNQDHPSRSETPKFTVTTRLVVLDVAVTDKSGNAIPDLKQEDFAIYEDKVPQKIRYFEVPAQHRLTPELRVESTTDLAKAPEAPVTILVLDELNTRYEDMSFARYALEKYLTSQPAVLPQPVTLLVVGNTKFQVLQDYTRDRQAILKVLAKHFPDYPWRLVQSGKSGPGAAERLAMSIGSLEQIAQATSGHPGRKNVVWVGRGFPSVNTKESTDKEADVIKSALAHVINVLRDARITLTMIDPTINAVDTVEIASTDDLDAAEDSNGSDPFAGDINFQLLAPATGGRVYFSRNDVDAEIGTSIRDGNQYYTLSYAPSNGNDLAQPYRRISVKIDRPGLTATTRNGYYIQAEHSAPPSTSKDLLDLRARIAFDLDSAANSNIAYIGLPSTVSRLSSRIDTFVVHVDSRALNWREMPDGSLQAEVTLLAGSFSKQNRLVAHTVQEMTAHTRTSQPQSAQPATADFTITTTIPKDAARVRFVVRDAASRKLGTADFSLGGSH